MNFTPNSAHKGVVITPPSRVGGSSYSLVFRCGSIPPRSVSHHVVLAASAPRLCMATLAHREGIAHAGQTHMGLQGRADQEWILRRVGYLPTLHVAERLVGHSQSRSAIAPVVKLTGSASQLAPFCGVAPRSPSNVPPESLLEQPPGCGIAPGCRLLRSAARGGSCRSPSRRRYRLSPQATAASDRPRCRRLRPPRAPRRQRFAEA